MIQVYQEAFKAHATNVRVRRDSVLGINSNQRRINVANNNTVCSHILNGIMNNSLKIATVMR
jgi:hypothetical protein